MKGLLSRGKAESGDSSHLLDRHGFNFLVGGVALQDLLDAVLDECRHSFLERRFQHILGACFHLHHTLHLVRAKE